MKFRLTCEGELRATQRDPTSDQRNPLALHKHAIRRVFHTQLKHLWATDRFLGRYRISPDNPNLGQQPDAAADSMRPITIEAGFPFTAICLLKYANRGRGREILLCPVGSSREGETKEFT